MRVQRYIKYLKPANEKCLISGILVFLCKIRRNGRKKTDAKRIQKSLTREATVPELRFKDVAEKLGLNLKFQQRIDIFVGRRIKKFYFPDFLDRKNKIIFEVDGGYHFTEEQRSCQMLVCQCFPPPFDWPTEIGACALPDRISRRARFTLGSSCSSTW